MKLKVCLLGAGLLCMPYSSLFAQSVTIQYGEVVSSITVNKDASYAGGALAGGLIGAMVGPRRHRGLRAVAGAGIGAGIQGSATSGTQQQYTVNLKSGGTTIINTEQLEIRIGDCVSIEQGAHDNIRRVSSMHCETATQVPAHHASASSDCETAKNMLVAAETDEDIVLAAKKVRILCED